MKNLKYILIDISVSQYNFFTINRFLSSKKWRIYDQKQSLHSLNNSMKLCRHATERSARGAEMISGKKTDFLIATTNNRQRFADIVALSALIPYTKNMANLKLQSGTNSDSPLY